jgi:hypothetical protein
MSEDHKLGALDPRTDEERRRDELAEGRWHAEDHEAIVREALEHYRVWTFAMPVTPKMREKRQRVEVALDAVRASDPASVLAVLLAEQPDATIAALEALLMGEQAMDEAAAAFSALDHSEADLPHSERSGPYEYARFMFSAACRSLRPKAPKEDDQ